MNESSLPRGLLVFGYISSRDWCNPTSYPQVGAGKDILQTTSTVVQI